MMMSFPFFDLLNDFKNLFKVLLLKFILKYMIND